MLSRDSLLDAVRLWATVEPYASFRSQTLAWRLLPAVESEKCWVFYRDGRLVGLVTWGFMTAEEFETRVYWGPDVFSRNSGELLVLVDMIAPSGMNDVLWMSRKLRRYFRGAYPEVDTVVAHRGSRIGTFPNRGG